MHSSLAIIRQFKEKIDRHQELSFRMVWPILTSFFLIHNLRLHGHETSPVTYWILLLTLTHSKFIQCKNNAHSKRLDKMKTKTISAKFIDSQFFNHNYEFSYQHFDELRFHAHDDNQITNIDGTILTFKHLMRN